MDFEVQKLQYVNDIESSSRRFKGSNSKINSLKEEILETENKIKNNKELLDASLKNKNGKEDELQKTLKRHKECENEISEISIDSKIGRASCRERV